ncbi:MAG: NUDIX hydrolase [Oscillospiraceae bacterium]|nr:NUDIX hydrolase [Oscillospiraceae bacterium]
MEELRDARGLTEAEAIARYRSKNYPKPALTADIVVFTRACEKWQVLLIRRKGHLFLGKLAFPGGFANENEPIEQTAARELEEETGVSGLALRLVDVFSAPGRDPRGWTVSAAFMAVVDQKPAVHAGDDAADAFWLDLDQIDAAQLAFDHAQILKRAAEMLPDAAPC